jgi:hypothetical protein
VRSMTNPGIAGADAAMERYSARANAAIYGLSTFLGSRKIAEDLSDRRRVEEMEGRVRELIEEIAANRRQFAELVKRTRPE